MPYCVGLTGGIGCGKSAAADMFAALGAHVVDTDAISHELTAPGGAAMIAIGHEFGPDFVRGDGGLDRARMRGLVFSDATAKSRLEAILHPLIRARVRDAVQASTGAYVLLVVPLLLETGSYRDAIHRVLVVDCPEPLQIERTMARSRLTEDEVRRIMATQVARERRLREADDVLANDADIETLRANVEALHAQYLAAARAVRGPS